MSFRLIEFDNYGFSSLGGNIGDVLCGYLSLVFDENHHDVGTEALAFNQAFAESQQGLSSLDLITFFFQEGKALALEFHGVYAHVD